MKIVIELDNEGTPRTIVVGKDAQVELNADERNMIIGLVTAIGIRYITEGLGKMITELREEAESKNDGVYTEKKRGKGK